MQPPIFKIKNHRLEAEDGTEVPYVRSPNQKGPLEPKYLLMHYTAGRSAESSINWLTNPEAQASAHVVIGKDGSVTQLVAFNRKAWHAGRSEWNDLLGMNSHSIGIELDNAGRMIRHGDQWFSWFGEPYPEEEVIEAIHKHEQESAGWHAYPAKQLEVAIGVATAIMRKYELLDVIGHDDVSPHRKQDPGPAFPMVSFRSMVMGRQMDAEFFYETTEDLNIRIGPGTDFEQMEGSPLSRGTKVIVLNHHEFWRYVEVIQNIEHEGCGMRGWVSGRYLKMLAP